MIASLLLVTAAATAQPGHPDHNALHRLHHGHQVQVFSSNDYMAEAVVDNQASDQLRLPAAPRVEVRVIPLMHEAKETSHPLESLPPPGQTEALPPSADNQPPSSALAHVASDDFPSRVVAFPQQSLAIIVHPPMGWGFPDTRWVEIYVNGEVVNEADRSAASGTYRFTFDCPTTGRHIIQARCLMLDGQWTNVSQPIHLEIRRPETPEIVAVYDVSTRLPGPDGLPKIGGEIGLRLAGVSQYDWVVSYIDGQPYTISKACGSSSDCQFQLSLDKLLPGMHTLAVRNLGRIPEAATLGEMSRTVNFLYAPCGRGFMDFNVGPPCKSMPQAAANRDRAGHKFVAYSNSEDAPNGSRAAVAQQAMKMPDDPASEDAPKGSRAAVAQQAKKMQDDLAKSESGNDKRAESATDASTDKETSEGKGQNPTPSPYANDFPATDLNKLAFSVVPQPVPIGDPDAVNDLFNSIDNINQTASHPLFEWVFADSAHFPDRRFDARGGVMQREGLIIYEGMRVSVSQKGSYVVTMVVEAPPVPTTMHLQLTAVRYDGQKYTVTLPPMRLVADDVREQHLSRNWIVRYRGFEPTLADGQLAKFERSGTARFGFHTTVEEPDLQ